MNINTMKMTFAVALSLALPVVAFSQTKADKAPTVAMPKTDRISMSDFRKLHSTGDVVVIDVRANGSYLGGHIPGAISIPEESINAAVAEKLIRMGKKVAAYCS